MNVALERIRQRARATVNANGRPLVILNLNQFSPLYVMREFWEGPDKAKGYVETIQPEGVAQ